MTAPVWHELKNCKSYPTMREWRASYRGLTLIVRGRDGGSSWRYVVKDTDGVVLSAHTAVELSIAYGFAKGEADRVLGVAA